MYSLQQLNELYDKKFSVDNFHTAPSGLYNPVNHIMSIKGKRIRPLLLLLSCDMFGGNVETALNPAFAMEVFHNFTLVHDDIMDQADIRRGEPTVHRKYGLNAAILAGDVMLSYAYKYLVDVPGNVTRDLLDVFNKTAIEIFEGQQMDMDFEKRTDVQEEEYLKMIEYKTSVLLGCSLQAGAIVAGASKEDQQHIYNFGLQLGLSFQIKDDYLDSFGEAEKVGKRIGGDILQNKKTHLFIGALNKSNEAQRLQLTTLLTEANEELKINSVKQLFEQTGARAYTLNRADELYINAIKSLDKVSVNSAAKANLRTLAEMINNRTF